jgi:alkylation response protein AidB-like acyl-CoA dehydrogenase
MDFGWTPQDEAFRTRVREFLARELPPDWEALSRHGPGSPEQTAFSLEFCPKLAAAGLLIPHWPAEHGGNNSTPWEHFILGEEMWAAGEPRGPQYMNVNWIGTTLMRFGSAEQKATYLPEIAAGRGIWCQGFSEPSSGSDLASLRTSAAAEGDTYRINGSKVWTSYAGLADHCFLLARTGGSGKAGIAIFLVPMATPGITVRPIPSLIGAGDIHEVFFDNVLVPRSARLGEEGQAWPIITYSLSNERVGIARYAFSLRVLDGMVARLRHEGRFDDPVIRYPGRPGPRGLRGGSPAGVPRGGPARPRPAAQRGCEPGPGVRHCGRPRSGGLRARLPARHLHRRRVPAASVAP